VRCAHSLLAQELPGGLEIFIIDNHSQDDSIGVLRTRLRSLPNIHILESRDNVGYARGNHIGILRAEGRYLLIINPDNELAPGALAQMISVMEADPGIGILAPKLIHEDGSVRDSARSFPSITDVLIKRTFLQHVFPGRLERYLERHADPSTPRDVDWVVGACLLIRRDLFAQLGGFDERFFLFFEDMDLCRRCWALGKRVRYFPAAIAQDRKRRLSEGTILSLLRKQAGRAHLISAVKYFAKWHGQGYPTTRNG
jgi:GT2 family glycosyltransferase